MNVIGFSGIVRVRFYKRDQFKVDQETAGGIQSKAKWKTNGIKIVFGQVTRFVLVNGKDGLHHADMIPFYSRANYRVFFKRLCVSRNTKKNGQTKKKKDSRRPRFLILRMNNKTP